MVCGCPECGSLMIQEQKGLDSRCICKECGYSCSLCLGKSQKPLDKDDLMSLLSQYEKTKVE